MWATEKQIKFIRSLILKNGTKAELGGKHLVLANGTIYRIGGNNDSLIFGGVKFSEASTLIDSLLNKKFEIKE